MRILRLGFSTASFIMKAPFRSNRLFPLFQRGINSSVNSTKKICFHGKSIEIGSSVNESFLKRPLKTGHMEFAAYLLKEKLSSASEVQSIFFVKSTLAPSSIRNIDDLRVLVKAAFETADGAKKWQILTDLLKNGSDEAFKAIIAEEHVDVNMCSNGLSLLMFAIKHQKDDRAQWLIERGANKCYVNPEGETPLKVALSSRGENYHKLMNMLLEKPRNPKPIF